MYLFTAHTTVQEPCESSKHRNKQGILGVDLSFLVDTRFQLQPKFLDIFWSIFVLDEVEGEEVGVLCVLKKDQGDKCQFNAVQTHAGTSLF